MTYQPLIGFLISPQMGVDQQAMVGLTTTAHFERYVSGIFDNEKKSNK